MKQWEVQWTLYQQRLASIRVSVSRYKGPSEHDECVRDMKFLLGEIDRLTHMAEVKQSTSEAGGAGMIEQLATLQAQLAAAQKVKADYDRWLSGGVYFTTAEYEKHVADHGQQVEAVQTQLTQLQAQVRTAVERWRAQTNVQEGIVFRMAMKALEATLHALTPAGGGVK